MFRSRILLAVLAWLACAIAPAAALDFPTYTGRVVDEAGILDAGLRASLTQKLADLEARTTDQFVVVTLKSLQGTTIEDFGVQLGRAWKIGQKDKNNGVLLIVAPTERKVRIEVGYGLEGTLTDAITKIIIENSIIPRFRANDIPGGIVRGVDDIISAITDNDDWKQRAQAPPKITANGISWIIFILFFGMFGFVFLVIMRDIVRRPSGRRAGGWTTGPSAWVPPSSGGGFSGGGFSGGGGGFSGGGGSFGGGGSSGSW
jgi:uncharacterized protein